MSDETEVKRIVRRAYGDVAAQALEKGKTSGCCSPQTRVGSSCCGPHQASTCCGSASQAANATRLYQAEELADLPESVSDIALGCGNPTAIADLKPGEVVLDLGSGGGIDCFLAARQVGPEGRVIGLDMTPEMVKLARQNAKKLGVTNVDFRYGEIEDIPLPDASVDVIISNCVINLSPDKDAVFAEAYRVLKPGGRLVISDMVTTGPLSDAVRRDLAAWAGCVAGALEESVYLDKIRRAGFSDVKITQRNVAEVAEWAAVGQAEHVAPHLRELVGKVVSIHVSARKP